MEKVKILSIESSGSTCSAAISEENVVLAEYSVFKLNYHDKMLAELVRRLMLDLGISIEALSAVAVSSGPGSFTGLRIGASLAKGLCFNNHPKLIAVPTLEAIAYSQMSEKDNVDSFPFLVVSASHKDFVYVQNYDENCEPSNEIRYLTLDELQPLINSHTPILISGMKVIPSFFTNYKLVNLTAGLLSKAAYKYYQQGNFADSESFVPLYQQEFVVKSKSI